MVMDLFFYIRWAWPNFKVLYLYSPGGTEENYENFRIGDLRAEI
jgi:hypothetical protein